MRVLTYNIRGGLGMDGRRDTARIAAVTAALSPDVVCFQEVHRRLPWSGFVDQPRRLHDGLGMEFSFQANLKVGVGGYGLGIATRHPVRAVHRHFLPSVREQRGVLEVCVGMPDGPLTVFCTHWGLSREERAGQAARMAEWLSAASRPLVVCGDLNERPEADYIRAMREQVGLCDAGEEENAPTYPADRPEARIDVVFHSPDLRLERLRAEASLASDHCPVWADFSPG